MLIEIPEELATVDAHGNRLIALHLTTVWEIAKRFSPLTHSLVIGEQSGSVLFVFNKWKNEWELPGGVIEPGETAAECANRELYEETNKKDCDLSLFCVMEWRLGSEQRIEFGALYRCQIAESAETVDSDEIGDTMFWDLEADIGIYAELDRTLALIGVSSV